MTLLATMGAALTAAIAFHQPPAQSGAANKNVEQFEHIDGKREPHRIPPEVAWENLFTVVASVLDDTLDDAREERIRALAVYNLDITPAEARIVADVAMATRTKVAILRAPMDREHGTGEPLNWAPEQYRQRHDDVTRTILDARASIQKKLSASALAQLEKYILEKVAPGTQIVRRVAQ